MFCKFSAFSLKFQICFSITRTIFSHSSSEQFWQQNTIFIKPNQGIDLHENVVEYGNQEFSVTLILTDSSTRVPIWCQQLICFLGKLLFRRKNTHSYYYLFLINYAVNKRKSNNVLKSIYIMATYLISYNI